MPPCLVKHVRPGCVRTPSVWAWTRKLWCG